VVASFRPLIGASLLARPATLYAGLAYPIIVALITVVVGGLYIRESRQVRIWDEGGGETAEMRQVNDAGNERGPSVSSVVRPGCIRSPGRTRFTTAPQPSAVAR